MAFVYYGEEIFGEVVQKAERAVAFASAVEVARIVLDACAVAKLFYHLHVVSHALFDALCLQLAGLVVEELYLLAQVELYLRHGRSLPLRRCHEEVGRVDVEPVVGAEVGVVVGVDGDYRLYLVAPEHYPYYYVLVCEPNVYRVALHSEVSALEIDLVAAVEGGHELSQEGVAGYAHATLHSHHVFVEILRVAHAV